MADERLESLDEALEAYADPRQAAERAGLRHVSDDEPGLRRKRWGRGFTYLDPEGEHVTDEALRERIEALAIPPAWTDVWICADFQGHILATGRDDKGRKQYIYHPDWQAVRSEAKFYRMIPFGKALSQIRARCEHDLQLENLPRDKVLAVVTTLLDRTLIRVGHASYAAENDAFGLTSLRDRHVTFSAKTCTFTFQGKSGKKHEIEFTDPRLAQLVRACRDVPGYHLFQYYDESGERGAIYAEDVNAYLKETTGQDFTAKDFRTWGGSVHAAVTLTSMPPFETEQEGKKNVVQMVKEVADRLGNTPSVCRNYYIHPAVIDAYLDRELLGAWRKYLRRKPLPQLEAEETALLYFLEDRLGD